MFFFAGYGYPRSLPIGVLHGLSCGLQTHQDNLLFSPELNQLDCQVWTPLASTKVTRRLIWSSGLPSSNWQVSAGPVGLVLGFSSGLLEPLVCTGLRQSEIFQGLQSLEGSSAAPRGARHSFVRDSDVQWSYCPISESAGGPASSRCMTSFFRC